jgi:hypothetical protein
MKYLGNRPPSPNHRELGAGLTGTIPAPERDAAPALAGWELQPARASLIIRDR